MLFIGTTLSLPMTASLMTSHWNSPHAEMHAPNTRTLSGGTLKLHADNITVFDMLSFYRNSFTPLPQRNPAPSPTM
jgi:hypothetical protein